MLPLWAQTSRCRQREWCGKRMSYENINKKQRRNNSLKTDRHKYFRWRPLVFTLNKQQTKDIENAVDKVINEWQHPIPTHPVPTRPVPSHPNPSNPIPSQPVTDCVCCSQRQSSLLLLAAHTCDTFVWRNTNTTLHCRETTHTHNAQCQWKILTPSNTEWVKLLSSSAT